MSIQKKIDTVIKSIGSINVQDFVEISNFDKDSGFYNKPDIEKIGKNGQFITSPEISSLFSIALANQFLKEFPEEKNVNLLELGPGNGLLTIDIYNYLKSKHININNITLLEKSDYFKKNIIERLELKVNFVENISDYKTDSEDIVFIYSNEFFDAIGSKQFIYNNGNFNELKISKSGNKYMLIQERSIISKELIDYYSNYKFKNDDILEHSNLILNILGDIKKLDCKKYFFTTTDYGYTKLPFKSTLRLLSNHKKLDLFDKFENVDYSFGVNFELLRNFFGENNPFIINQNELIYNNLSYKYLRSSDKNTKKIIELISGEKFDDIGKSFLNFSFKKNE
tara:strand:+ start:536 stop:1552 length:1017 start_codon:yes stop_codon:yes gene_type:complete